MLNHKPIALSEGRKGLSFKLVLFCYEQNSSTILVHKPKLSNVTITNTNHHTIEDMPANEILIRIVFKIGVLP